MEKIHQQEEEWCLSVSLKHMEKKPGALFLCDDSLVAII